MIYIYFFIKKTNLSLKETFNSSKDNIFFSFLERRVTVISVLYIRPCFRFLWSSENYIAVFANGIWLPGELLFLRNACLFEIWFVLENLCNCHHLLQRPVLRVHFTTWKVVSVFGVFLIRNQPKYGKIRTRKTPNTVFSKIFLTENVMKWKSNSTMSETQVFLWCFG